MSTILACVFTGIFLGGAWWVYGDGVIAYRALHPSTEYVGHYVVPGIMATASMVGLNLGMRPHHVQEHWEARLWMFFCCMIAFVSIGLSTWFIVVDPTWPVISIVVQSLLLLMAGMLFFFRNGTSTDNEFSMY